MEEKNKEKNEVTPKSNIAELILGDYAKVSLETEDNMPTNKYGLASYFDRSSSSTSNHFAPLANNVGEKAVNELISFIASVMCPPSGEWLHVVRDDLADSDTDRVALSERLKAKNIIIDALNGSNFQIKLRRLILDGVLYGRGLMGVINEGGISYQTYDPYNTFVSFNSTVADTRIYSEVKMSKEEILTRFKYNVGYNKAEEKKKELDPDHINELETILECIIPQNHIFFNNWTPTVSFIKVYIHLGSRSIISDIKTKELYTRPPLITWASPNCRTLGELALTDAIQANRYEVAFSDRESRVNEPAIAVDLNTLSRGRVSLQPKSVIGLEANERLPAPVVSQIPSNINEQTIARKELAVKETLMIPLIRSFGNINASQVEVASSRYMLLMSLNSVIAPLATVGLTEIIMRTVKLLAQSNKKFGKLLSKIGNGLVILPLSSQMTHYKTLASIGRFGQAVSPFYQMNPQAMGKIDVDQIIESSAEALGIPFILKPDEQLVEELKAQENALDEQQQTQDQFKQQEINNKQQPEGGII